MGTKENKEMNVAAYRDDKGRPTCCAMIGSGVACRCALLDEDWTYCHYLHSWPAYRDHADVGLVPDPGCPIWEEEER